MSEADWHPRAICPECGWHAYAPFGSIFHVHVECCPSCGEHKTDCRSFRLGRVVWEVKTMRRVIDTSGSVWWKPWTWCSQARWETRAT
jgi:hypothetical protein